MEDDRRLIEDYLPIEAISAEASREKSIRKGHISTLHLWWARRPLVACRAAVYGALVPADRWVKDIDVKNPPTDPAKAEAFKNGAKRGLNCSAAAEFVTRLCKYPGDPKVIAQAQRHIFEAHAERLTRETGKPVTVEDIQAGRAPRPKVLDMFAGGGAIPLEALRLGCEAYALDLNPVAYIIQLCTLLYPQKYGTPDPNARGMTGPKNERGENTWGGLADEVRYWGNWVLKEVRAEIGDLYPLIPDPAYKGKRPDVSPNLFKESDELPAGYLMPVAYLWTRTVTCKNPTCKATVPLVKQTWLCKKSDRYAAFKMVPPTGEKRVAFKVVEARTEQGLGFDPEDGSKAGNATCPFCGTVADSDYVKGEGNAGRLGFQPMGMAATGTGRAGKSYFAADDLPGLVPDGAKVRERIEALCVKTGLTVPSEAIINDAKGALFCVLYGLKTWGDVFSPRQTLCLLTFAGVVRRAESEMRKTSLDHDCIKALATYLAAMTDKLADFNSVQCTWNYTGGRGVKNSFSRQTLGMTWDCAETNPFNDDAASWPKIIEDIPAAIEMLSMAGTTSPAVERGSAIRPPWPDASLDAVVTDPPYYDNVPYADISDFFYVWLKRTVGHLYPEHFANEGTPKKTEAVADAVRHAGDKRAATLAYESMMAQAFAETGRMLKAGGTLVVVYAHKTTLGWSTLLEALRRAGFMVTEAWPLDTEMKGRVRAMDSAALATSIFLVARKRDGRTVGSYETEVSPELDAGEAIIFANGTHVELDGPSGLSSGARALVEKKKGKYRLHDFTKRGEDDNLGLPGEAGEPAPLIDVLHRTLWLMERRPGGLAEFLRDAQPNREQMRLVAQALAGPALKGGELADVSPSAELSALGKLTANWRSVIEDNVFTPVEQSDRKRGQRSLFDQKK